MPLCFFLYIKAIRENSTTHGRVLQAYVMMLDFYGMELVSDVDGTVRRCKRHWDQRYAHLNKYGYINTIQQLCPCFSCYMYM